MMSQKTPPIALAAAALCFLSTAAKPALATDPGATGTTITYTASGIFASTPISGSDSLELAGERFTVTVTVGAAAKPTQTGKNWALYKGLTLAGKVHSGLVGPPPVTIGSKAANIQQLINPGHYDVFRMGAPLRILSLSISLVANITLPSGTLKGPRVQPFSPVSLSPANGSLTYYEGGAGTTLAIQSGTLSSTSSASAVAVVAGLSHAEGRVTRIWPWTLASRSGGHFACCRRALLGRSHRPRRNSDTRIGEFEGQSDIGSAIHSAGYNVWYTLPCSPDPCGGV